MERSARRIVVTGRVQGVGYRPFVYVTAQELGLTGSVLNGSGKVFIHAEGSPSNLGRLEKALIHAAPPLARPSLALSEPAALQSAATFEILASDSNSEPEIHVPPDLFTCDDCVEELTDPGERRFGYPFINCTQCGPRYTIITAMPYDRPNTSMADFPLCDDCRTEYESPRDRRFHAQPLACPVCGPQLEFIVGGRHAADPPSSHVAASLARDIKSQKSEAGNHHSEAKNQLREQGSLLQAIQAIENGQIVAIKGVGGYHLVCDAGDDDAVKRLRSRKQRPHKPLAVMFPVRGEDGLDAMREQLQLDQNSAEAILDPVRPIVLVAARGHCGLSAQLAPGLSELGVFLPYSPLHHQLLKHHGKPIVATSGNISGEPVITDKDEAEQRLARVADAFLHHNRPIVRPADDPVIRPMAGQARVVRLGRGIAPLELQLPTRLVRPILATGGHMKVTVALAWDDRVVISPHIGDLDSLRSNDIFSKIIRDIQELYNVNSQEIACDLHPGYASSRWAQRQGAPLRQVQHHAAHASSLAGEHPDIEKWLVFTWDGVGYGSDGTLWGGEALAGKPGAWNRMASFRPFKLVGGDKAGREPWRSAAALMWAENKPWDAVDAAVEDTHHAVEHEIEREIEDTHHEIGEIEDTHHEIGEIEDTHHEIGEIERDRGEIGDTHHSREIEDTHHEIGEIEDTHHETGEIDEIEHEIEDTHHSRGLQQALTSRGVALAYKAWNQNINVFETSAVGRLFDAAAALVLNRNMASFEGQGPMELEHIAEAGHEPVTLPLQKDNEDVLRSDWAPLLDMLADRHITPERRAGIFHESMAQAVVDQALAIRDGYDYSAVGLSGGVFQNRLLTERVVAMLHKHGIEVRLHKDVPANDGGLCFGQIIEAQAMQERAMLAKSKAESQ